MWSVGHCRRCSSGSRGVVVEKKKRFFLKGGEGGRARTAMYM
jgi:hypothetical protein